MDRSPPAPQWVYKRDGRVEAFDADRLCRALFAATERLGHPDAFTARELADGIIHFLAEEVEGQIPTTAQVAETAIKVVRELGHPALAQAYEAASQETATPQPHADVSAPAESVHPASDLLHEYALREVFACELVSAHEEGLLILTGLAAPLELSACLLDPPQPGRRLLDAVEASRRLAGGCVVIDGAEHRLGDFSSPAQFARELGMGLQAAGLFGVVNLNAAPPAWAGDLADGPLFASQRGATPPPEQGEQLLEQLLGVADAAPDLLRIDWHVGSGEEEATQLAGLVCRALAGAPITLALDRPRKSVPLAEGIDRQHPAALMTVGLNLPRLAEELERRGGRRLESAGFLDKLGSLARLALSAGLQKRTFLRRSQRSWPPFLLDRARLVVAPVGLAAVAGRLTPAPAAPADVLELGRRIVQRLADALRHDGRAAQLDAALDTPIAAGPTFLAPAGAGDQPCAEHAAGVGVGDLFASPRSQVEAAGALHAAGGPATAIVRVPAENAVSLDELVGLVRWAWRNTDIARLRFLPR